MLVTSAFGIIANLVMLFVLGHGHSHGGQGDHGHSHSHAHSHSNGNGNQKSSHQNINDQNSNNNHGHSHGHAKERNHGHNQENCKYSKNQNKIRQGADLQNGESFNDFQLQSQNDKMIKSSENDQYSINYNGQGQSEVNNLKLLGHSHEDGKIVNNSNEQKSNSIFNVSNTLLKENENMNLRAAYLHIVGDLIQSFGVFLASLIIWIGKA